MLKPGNGFTSSNLYGQTSVRSTPATQSS